MTTRVVIGRVEGREVIFYRQDPGEITVKGTADALGIDTPDDYTPPLSAHGARALAALLVIGAEQIERRKR